MLVGLCVADLQRVYPVLVVPPGSGRAVVLDHLDDVVVGVPGQQGVSLFGVGQLGRAAVGVDDVAGSVAVRVSDGGGRLVTVGMVGRAVGEVREFAAPVGQLFQPPGGVGQGGGVPQGR